jgi:two-component system, OmpR family, sensor kinase
MPATPRANQDRYLRTVQRLLEIPAANLETALTHASDAVADALAADKVDAFLYDETRDSLCALGVSTQPLSNLQRRLGLDVLPVSNGGSVVAVYVSGEPLVVADLREMEDELRGVKEGLNARSQIAVPLLVGGKRRGVLAVVSQEPGIFTDDDVAFVKGAARWVGVLAEHSELTASIERTALEAGRRSRAEEIIAVLAHDLRGYLSPVMLRLYLIRNRAVADARKADVDDVDRALRGVTQANALMSDLLDAARLDAGAFQMRLEPVDVATLMTQSAAAIGTPEHAITVESMMPIIVAADAARLRQCIDNVLRNALAHSPEHAPVDVVVSLEQRDGKAWACIEVVDEGPGIPEETLPHLFDRFFTGCQERGGVGLGLYIAHRIAAAHGGEIVADRFPGRGARFTIRLPAVPDADDAGLPA